MGRGVRSSSGGGESQLGYLFGSENPPWPKASANRSAVAAPPPLQPELQSPAGLVKNAHAETAGPAAVTAASVSRQNGKAEDSAAALTHKLGRNFNNYHRADGQNTGNFITVSSVSTNSSGNISGDLLYTFNKTLQIFCCRPSSCVRMHIHFLEIMEFQITLNREVCIHLLEDILLESLHLQEPNG
jgi:SPIRAL1-like protein